MNKIRRRVHRANGKNHTSKAPNKAKMDTVHTCPTKYRCSFGRTKVWRIIFTELYAHGGKVNFTLQKLLKCSVHNNLHKYCWFENGGNGFLVALACLNDRFIGKSLAHRTTPPTLLVAAAESSEYAARLCCLPSVSPSNLPMNQSLEVV